MGTCVLICDVPTFWDVFKRFRLTSLAEMWAHRLYNPTQKIPWESLWKKSYGNPMGFLWEIRLGIETYSHGIPKGFLRDSHGIPMGNPLKIPFNLMVYSMGFPLGLRVFYGIPMGFLRDP